MIIIFIVPEFGARTDCTIMSSVPLPIVETTAANTRKVFIPLSDEGIKNGLGFTQVVGPCL